MGSILWDSGADKTLEKGYMLTWSDDNLKVRENSCYGLEEKNRDEPNLIFDTLEKAEKFAVARACEAAHTFHFRTESEFRERLNETIPQYKIFKVELMPAVNQEEHEDIIIHNVQHCLETARYEKERRCRRLREEKAVIEQQLKEYDE